MELSSPLAAMHPPPIPGPWGYRRDLPPSRPLFGGANTFRSKNFNFRDMSMKKSNTDYFTLQPIRGSSPTASLAADMSSNLHVDQSPQVATPRRSLFTQNLFQPLDNRAEGTTTPPFRWEGVTTPPIPSSSPNFGPDSMDISPLPHKAPFSFLSDLSIPSPTPEAKNDCEDMLAPCTLPPSNPLLEVPRPVSAADRRRSALLRPSLARNKNWSTNTVSLKTKETAPLPPFRFGMGSSGLSISSTPTLDECFAASPPQDRKMFGNPLIGPPKPKQPFVNASVVRGNGSPLSAHIRKPAGPPSRRPSKFRRSLSMYESPGDIINQDKESSTSSTVLQSVMDVDDTPALKLPHFVPANEPDSTPRISDTTLINVLNGDFSHIYNKIVIVDCRFEYEYKGGHIDGAINFCDKERLAEELFDQPSPPNTLLIFHCEYSAHRAPLMAKFVRGRDRSINEESYPHLTYPEVYILEGGYSSFYESHRSRCIGHYLRMDAKEHESACERGMNKLRQRTKLNRAQTFAFGQQTFGQQSCQMEDSPTANSRSKTGGILPMGMETDNCFNLGRVGTRRMASY